MAAEPSCEYCVDERNEARAKRRRALAAQLMRMGVPASELVDISLEAMWALRTRLRIEREQ